MIGLRIREYRRSKGVKVADFAILIGISQGSLSDIENGKTKPSAETLASIVRHTDIDSRWLLTGGEQHVAAEPTVQYIQAGSSDPQISEMIGIMRDLDKAARADLLRQARKELKLKRLEDVDQEKSELIDALEPRVAERLKKLENITPEAAEEQKKRGTVTVRKRKKVLQ